MSPTNEEVHERVRTIVAKIMRIPPEQVTRDAVLTAELGLESLDYVDLVFQLETAYKVKFYELSVFEKLEELFSGRELSSDGGLTEFGAEVLRGRMPEVDPKKIQAGMPTAEIEDLYTPETFARSVMEMLALRRESGEPDQRPTQDEALRRWVEKFQGSS